MFSDNPEAFMYLLVGLAVLNIFSFVFMYLTGYYMGPLPKAIESRALEMYNETKTQVTKQVSVL